MSKFYLFVQRIINCLRTIIIHDFEILQILVERSLKRFPNSYIYNLLTRLQAQRRQTLLKRTAHITKPII